MVWALAVGLWPFFIVVCWERVCLVRLWFFIGCGSELWLTLDFDRHVRGVVVLFGLDFTLFLPCKGPSFLTWLTLLSFFLVLPCGYPCSWCSMVEVFVFPLAKWFVVNYWHVLDPDWYVRLEVALHSLSCYPLYPLGGFPHLSLLLSGTFSSFLVIIVLLGSVVSLLWVLLHSNDISLFSSRGECFSWCWVLGVALVEWFSTLIFLLVLFLGSLLWLVNMVDAMVLLGGIIKTRKNRIEDTIKGRITIGHGILDLIMEEFPTITKWEMKSHILQMWRISTSR